MDGLNRGLPLARRNFHEQYDKGQRKSIRFSQNVGRASKTKDMVVDRRGRLEYKHTVPDSRARTQFHKE